MRRGFRATVALCAVILGAAALPAILRATPSTVFWAPATPALQPVGLMHVTYDTYFQRRSEYPVDVGLEMGVPGSKSVQAEAGFDLVYPTFGSDGPLDLPIVLNGRIGVPEGAMFPNSPGLAAGIFGLGFEKNVTDYDVIHVVLGKTLPRIGLIAAGAYAGLTDLLRDPDGERRRTGWLVGWASPSIESPALDHLQLAWDVQTGRNSLGATGGGVALSFTPAVSLLTGPVYFFEPSLQPGHARWMWSVQLDADLKLFSH